MSRKAERTELLSPQVGGEDFEAAQGRSKWSRSPGGNSKADNVRASVVEVAYEEVAQSGTENQLGWTSKWLQWPFLVMLASLMAVIAVILIVIWQLDVSKHGFAADYSSVNLYGWTYGPTIIFVIIASLWRQVDFYTKATIPWRELARGPRGAERTVLLDYLTPLTPVSLFRSVAYGHVPVLLSMVGYIILKVALLASSALLVLAPTRLDSNVAFNLTSDFMMTSDMQTAISSFKNYTLVSDVNIGYTVKINASAVHEYAGVLSGAFAPNVGIDGSYVYQDYLFDTSKSFTSATVDLGMLRANFSCEVATAGTNDTKLQLTSSSCSVGGPNQSYIEGNQIESCMLGSCPDYALRYYLSRVNCSETVAPPTWKGLALAPSLSINSTFDMRYALWVVNYTYPVGNEQHYSTGAGYILGHREQTAAIICKPDYTIGTGSVLYDKAKNATAVTSYAPQGRLAGFTGMMLGEFVANSLHLTQGMNLTADTQRVYDIVMPTYTLILENLPGSQNFSALLNDAGLFKSAAENVWNGVAANLMQGYAIGATATAAIGTINYVEDRLHLTLVSVELIAAALLLMAFASIYLAWSSHHPATSSNPAIIATSLDTLSSNTALQTLLRNAGAFTSKQLAGSLRDIDFSRRQHQDLYFNIKTASRPGEPANELPRTITKEQHSDRHAWKPLCVRWYMLILTFLLPFLLIFILEGLFQLSQQEQGVTDATGVEVKTTITARYLTSAVMFVVATLFNSLDFTVSLFAPYNLMSKGPMGAQQSLYFQVLGELPVVALWKSLRARHYSSALSNGAGLVGSLLTVVASGLWMVNYSVLKEAPVSAMIKDSFNTTWYNSSYAGDAEAAFTLDKVLWKETAMAPQIWNDYVMPNVVDITDQGQNYTLQIQALRPVLDCSVVPDSAVNVTTTTSASNSTTTVVSAIVPLESGCRFSNENGSIDQFSHSWSVPELVQSDYTLQTFSDIHLESGLAGESFPPHTTPPHDNPAGCPSIMVAYSYWLAGATDSEIKANTTILICSQRIEQASLLVSYSGDPAQPTVHQQVSPFVQPNSTQLLTNGTSGITSFPYRIEAYLGDMRYLEPIWGVDISASTFMDYVFHGPTPISAPAPFDKSGQQLLIQGVQKLYARYMSLVIHLKFRQPYAADLQPSMQIITGTANKYTSRLQMGVHSKLVLQLMLAAMIVLGAWACWLSDIRNTLPRQPSSIASVMALFAGSDLCESTHASAVTDMKQESELTSRVYSLGWWSSLPSLPHERSENAVVRRFGIDMGLANTLGYRETMWALRKRRRKHSERVIR